MKYCDSFGDSWSKMPYFQDDPNVKNLKQKFHDYGYDRGHKYARIRNLVTDEVWCYWDGEKWVRNS